MQKSILLYTDTLKALDHLSDEQAGKIFKAIYAHTKGEKTPLDGLMYAVFSQFEVQLERNAERYEAICKRNRINGKKGGRPEEPKKPTGLSGNPNKPKQTLRDSDSDSDSDSDREKDKVSKNPPNPPRGKNKVECPDDVSQDVWQDFLELRKAKRAKVTKTALAGIQREANKAGWTLEDALSECCARGWQGFNADFVKTTNQPKGKNTYDEQNTKKHQNRLAATQAIADLYGGLQDS